MKRLGIALAALVLLLILFIAATWAPDRPVADLQTRWAQPPSAFAGIAGMNVHLRDQGRRDDPSPIVLLHGTSASLHTWEGWVRALQEKRRVVSFDLPGFGLTGPAPNDDYSIEAYVRFVGALLDHLGIQKCTLGGNSFGGYVAWMSALAMPERVEKLILVDSGGYPLPAGSLPIAFRMAQTPGLAPVVENLLPRSVVAASVRGAYADLSKVSRELIDRYYELALRQGNRRALVKHFQQAPIGVNQHRITELKLPTFILWGKQDRLIPVDLAERFHKDIAGSELVIFNDLGHVPQEEDPARTVAALQQFLGLK